MTWRFAAVCGVFLFTSAVPAGSLAQEGATNPPGRPNPAGEKSAARRSGAGGEVLRFRTYRLMDPQGIGGEAASMLIPTDWKVDGGVVWRAHPALPAYATLRAAAPDGLTQLEAIPQMPFVDGIREMTARSAQMAGPQIAAQAAAQWPEGANYMGNEVRRVVRSPKAFIEQFVLPRYRRTVQYRAVKYEDLPRLADAVARAQPRNPGINTSAAAGRTRIEYRVGDRSVEEDVYVVLLYNDMPQLLTNYWGTERAFACRAAKGHLDEKNKLFRTILDSQRLNLQWFSKYNQVVQMLVQQQIRSIQRVGELSRYIARTSDEISDMMRQSYEERQASQDRINTRFSEYVRGVETYRDPDRGETVELPSGYNNAWYNGSSNEYIVTESELYNPNVEAHGSWTKLEKRE